jgi:hypothetical protein
MGGDAFPFRRRGLAAMDDTEPARTFLLRLLRQTELATCRGETRLASRAWTGEGIAPDALDACHRLLTEARRGGAVELVFGKGFQAHVIQRVRIADADRLAAFLGEPRYAVRLAAMDAALADVVAGGEPWLAEVLDQCRARWARGEAAFGLQPGDAEAARETLQILRAIAEDRHRGRDVRSFSIEVTGRSKALEERRQHVVAGLRRIFSIDDAIGAGEVLEAVGFEKFHQPLLIRADLEIGGATLRVCPYVGLPPELVSDLSLRRGFASYVIGIENLTSFNRYVREIDDGGVVIYTGGFPSRPVLSTIKRLAACTSAVWHWGDIDPGGVRIFRTIERVVPGLQPHMMDSATARALGREAAGDTSLSLEAFEGSAIAGIAAFLSRERTWMLEQEAVPPVAPPTLDGDLVAQPR